MKLIEVLLKELPKNGGWPNFEHARYAYRSKGVDNYFFGSAPTIVHPGDEMVLRTEYEAAIAALNKPEWNGEGLPPVGSECEVLANEDWKPMVIIAHYDGYAFAWNYDFGITVASTSPSVFRPIKTEAERKREEAISAMRNYATNFNNTQVIHAIEQVYDSIAAGKIPHITLN